MKPAGRKNPGAWYRANKLIKSLETPEEKANLAGSILTSLYADGAYNDIVSLRAEAGVNSPAIPVSKEAWVAGMMEHGIPLQVWMGHWTWTTYTVVDDVLVANYQYNIRKFAHDLRRLVNKYFLARRQTRDVFNLGALGHGNPGGYPDINPDN